MRGTLLIIYIFNFYIISLYLVALVPLVQRPAIVLHPLFLRVLEHLHAVLYAHLHTSAQIIVEYAM